MVKNTVQRYRLTKQLLRKSSLASTGAVQITISSKTVRKILEHLLPLPAPLPAVPQQPQPSLRPTLRPWIGIIDQIMKNDAMLPKKFRTTAMRILQKLRDEHGYPGGYSMVQEYVLQARGSTSPETNPRRLAQLGRRKKVIPPIASSQLADAAVSNFQPEECALPEQSVPSNCYRLSQRPQRSQEPEELVFEWMRNVLQGAIPLDTLTKELGDTSLPELEALCSAATKAELPRRNKAMAVMAYLRGISGAPICSFLQISTGSLFRYWRLFRKGGTAMLFAKKPRSDKQSNDEVIKNAVFSVLHSPPAVHGINRTTWRMADLRSVVSEQCHRNIGCEVIHTIIKEAGWKWRHARVVLTSNDPDYRAKVDAIKKILSQLKADEAFFSIDEYGPFAIKQKGGVKRVAPNERYVVAQRQKSKGWMILTAALELSRNQVSHFYSQKKNTDEMIKMADHLRSQYRACSTIYLSWDAASWHVSKNLAAHLEKINQQAAADGFPIVKTAPLPACSQFLNVIESVFSGMARAIIHNSDYPSVEAAQEAIDRYFARRNEDFAHHPKRAGKKIWGKERVPSMFAEGQNCKDPMYQYPIG